MVGEEVENQYIYSSVELELHLQTEKLLNYSAVVEPHLSQMECRLNLALSHQPHVNLQKE